MPPRSNVIKKAIEFTYLYILYRSFQDHSSLTIINSFFVFTFVQKLQNRSILIMNDKIIIRDIDNISSGRSFQWFYVNFKILKFKFE